MEQDKRKRQLLWVLVVVNGLAGFVWILGAFGVVTGAEGINLLYLAIGGVNLIASALWTLNARSS
jgi:hypothetical protein